MFEEIYEAKLKGERERKRERERETRHLAFRMRYDNSRVTRKISLARCFSPVYI